MEDDRDELIYFNGLDVVTGGYGLPPMTKDSIMRVVLAQPQPENRDDLEARKARDEMDAGDHLGIVEGVDPLDLAQAGWGMIFPAVLADDGASRAAQAAIKEALQPLLARRAAQGGARYVIYEGPMGHRPNEKKSQWLYRNGASVSGPVVPDKVPYYLLIIGSPARIPYSFQHQLDVQYAVGRLWFPRLEQYANYARSVVRAEEEGLRRKRSLVFFGARNEGDRATELSSRLLLQPLSETMTSSVEGWEVSTVMAEEATRATLQTLLGGETTPALLFTASHGAELPKAHPQQSDHQGALVCSDWPGPAAHAGPLARDWFFAGEDLTGAADVAGMMLFCFACFGAGTPQHDELLPQGPDATRRELAPAPFMGALPLSLLGRPNGALAVIGHVGRAWGCSFTAGGPRATSHIATFESSLRRLLDEQPVGHALDYFNARYAELSTMLTEELQDEFKLHDASELIALWTANNDARGYLVLGDPAARLSFTKATVPPLPRVTPARAEVAPDDRDVPTEIPRPAELGADDWERTPEAVRHFIHERLRAR